jgi:hypothetical protein
VAAEYHGVRKERLRRRNGRCKGPVEIDAQINEWGNYPTKKIWTQAERPAS